MPVAPMTHASTVLKPIQPNTSLDNISSIVLNDPDLINERDGKQCLPLHVAASQQRSTIEVVRFLADSWPQALQDNEEMGRLPLYVADKDVALEVIQQLVDRRPRAIQEPTDDDWYPVNIATLSQPLEVVQFLAEQRPQALQEERQEGLLPLQLG